MFIFFSKDSREQLPANPLPIFRKFPQSILNEVTYNDYLEQIVHHRRPNWKLILLGVLGSIFAHLFMWVLIPDAMLLYNEDKGNEFREFEITLAPAEEKIDPNYVPINPEDFSNPPDETNNFSSENAQAANEKVPDELNTDTPYLEGQSEEFTHLNEGAPATVVSTEVPPQPEESQKNSQDEPNQQESEEKLFRLEQEESSENQAPDRIRPDAFEDEQISEEGPLSLPEVPEIPEDHDKTEFFESETEGNEEGKTLVSGEYQKEQHASPETENPTQNQNSNQPPRKPQPRVNMRAGGPTLLSKIGVKRIASQANYSAEFSEFGVYLAQLFETIGIEWYILVDQNRLAEKKSSVVVEFKINQYGEVLDIVIIEATSSYQAQLICSAAVTNRAPYGDWTEDMKSMLNEPETIRLTFHY